MTPGKTFEFVNSGVGLNVVLGTVEVGVRVVGNGVGLIEPGDAEVGTSFDVGFAVEGDLVAPVSPTLLMAKLIPSASEILLCTTYWLKLSIKADSSL